MAKQVGPIFLTGTLDGVIFYKLNGQYLMRAKGDYKSGKQMRKDPRLKRTLQNADQFGVASKIVKYTYYRYLPAEVRRWGLYSELTGMVKRWLQAGKSREEAEALLIAYMQALVPSAETEATPTPTVAKPLPVIAKGASPLSTKNTVTAWPNRNTKKARYLSHWKVRHNGRLHIPKSKNSSLGPKPAAGLSAVEINV